jgi:hypothetical protein
MLFIELSAYALTIVGIICMYVGFRMIDRKVVSNYRRPTKRPLCMEDVEILKIYDWGRLKKTFINGLLSLMWFGIGTLCFKSAHLFISCLPDKPSHVAPP